jgi:ubiquinone/menaquinone biosynthesis C-methylase UbiE
MARTQQEQAHTERLAQQYQDRTAAVFLEIEREVLGGDYGATSWSDRHEVEHLARLLDLAPGVRTLEIGAGSGWPGLFLARRTGCAVTLADLPREGLRVARRRSQRDRLMRRCPATVADAATLPFADASFDAVYHCDVLC